MSVLVWVPDEDGVRRIGAVAGARLEPMPEPDEPLPTSAPDVEVLVPAFFAMSAAARLAASLPRLRLVQVLSAGVDRLAGALPDGVTLCDARGVHDATVAEWVVGALLADVKRLVQYAHAQTAQRWEYRFVGDLAGRTVLIVGYGSIGAAVEARLAPFDVELLRVARSARPGVGTPADLPALLPRADAVVLLVPLTAATTGLVDARFLAAMKHRALLVNAARGPVVATDALVHALRERRIRAVLDVTDPEPLPAGHPLWSAPGVVITPHIGGSTPLFIPRAYALVRNQIERYVAGQPLRNVVGAAGY